jgi:hypothetical protein
MHHQEGNMDNANRGSTRLDQLVDVDFANARRGVFLKGLLALLLNRPFHLLSFHEVQGSLDEERYVGICEVEVARIVGSVNRYQDFDRSFLPIRASGAERWKRVDRAHYQSIKLPPPILLKVDDVYFVYDGHNRVSVARLHGVECIQAEVVEYQRQATVVAPAQTTQPIPSRELDAELRRV